MHQKILCVYVLFNFCQVIINDLTFYNIKYVGYTTVISVSPDINDCTLQSSADFLIQWS